MEYVVIQGGVAQDTSKGVHIIDLDNIEAETEIEVLVAERDSAEQAGLDWAAEVIDSYIAKWFGAARETGVSVDELQDLADDLGIPLPKEIA